MALQDTENNIIRFCMVESVYDDQDGLRIKARLVPEENNIPLEDIPFAFPLLPKHVHINPKIGECVMVILSVANHIKSNRFFIGPLISQQYNLNEESFNGARKLLNGKWEFKPLPKIEMSPDNRGTVPNRTDVAVQGRDNADLILKDSEVRLRCGFKKNPMMSGVGALAFNDIDLAYIQMRHRNMPTLKKDSPLSEYRSEINIVADRINLLSHQSKDKFTLNDRDKLITEEEMENILNTAHPLIYGDEFAQYILQLVQVFLKHVHPFPGDPPCLNDTQKQVVGQDPFSMLSKSIRIN